MASSAVFPAVFKTDESATDAFGQKKFSIPKFIIGTIN